jgi:cobalt-zinc-cadmium efflux system protein
MAGHPGVNEVHDLHVWEVGSGFPSLSAHVLVATAVDCHAVRQQLETLLRSEFSVDHTTLQVEHESDELIAIEPAASGGRPGSAGPQ